MIPVEDLLPKANAIKGTAMIEMPFTPALESPEMKVASKASSHCVVVKLKLKKVSTADLKLMSHEGN